MSLYEESQPETEGEEVITIELSTSSSTHQNHDKTIVDPVPTKDLRSEYREKFEKEFNDESTDKNDGAIEPSTSTTSTTSSTSNNDICRICHMGSSPSNRGTSNDDTGNDRDRLIRNSSSSSNFNFGPLVSACRCRGSVGLVHTKCLERWLTQSKHTRCELCGYKYATIRIPRHGVLRSLVIWMRTFVATRQMLLDTLYLVVTTPLAVFSAYVCAMTLKMALENRIGDIPWTIVAMLPTCSVTLVAYWGWLLTLQRLHGRRWREFWQSNFLVQLVPDTPVDFNQVNDDLELPLDDPYMELPDLFNNQF